MTLSILLSVWEALSGGRPWRSHEIYPLNKQSSILSKEFVPGLGQNQVKGRRNQESIGGRIIPFLACKYDEEECLIL